MPPKWTFEPWRLREIATELCIRYAISYEFIETLILDGEPQMMNGHAKALREMESI